MLVALFLVFILSYAGVFATEKISKRLGICDEVSARKIHSAPTPRLGGLGFGVPLLLFFSYIFVSYRADLECVGAFVGLLLSVALGAFDDIFGLSAYKKLLCQGAIAVISADFLDTDAVILSGRELHVGGALGYTLSLFVIVALMNAVNLADGLDSLAVFTIFPAFAALSLLGGWGATSAILVGASLAMLGFLPRNLNPAKCFMGDSGSQSLGFLLGYTILAIGGGAIKAELFLLAAVPLLDMLSAALRRISDGRSPFSADKMHIHHKLLALGLSERSAAAALFFLNAAFALIALLICR